jgi:1,2-diacylglycerol 3-alpha-glucosyltransferase
LGLSAGESLRIGMMADVYKPHVSGITNYITLNKRALERSGHQVYVFTFGDLDYADDEERVIRSPGVPLLDTGFYLSLRYSAAARKLINHMDLVHVHHPFLSGSLALRYCRRRGIPLIFTNHTRYDLYAQAYLPVLPDVFGETALEAYLPSFCRACDLVITPSPGMRAVLNRFGVNTPIDVVPNGVDLGPFTNPTKIEAAESYGLREEDVVLIYTGRLGPEKNLIFLLRAFNGAAQAFENVKLLLVGDGPERDNLEDRVNHMGIQDRVVFTGMVPYHSLPGYLALADAFVTASVTEVHPLSVIEAMAVGLPVLGIQSPGVGDTIENGKTGFIVPEEDLAAFTARMARMITQGEERRDMGARAREAAQIYSIERTTEMLLERYTSVVSRTSDRKNSLRARWSRFLDRWVT